MKPILKDIQFPGRNFYGIAVMLSTILPFFSASADNIFFKSGDIVTGTVQFQSVDAIKVYTVKGTLETYSKKELRRIEFRPLPTLSSVTPEPEEDRQSTPSGESKSRDQGNSRSEPEAIKIQEESKHEESQRIEKTKFASIRHKEEEERRQSRERIEQQKREWEKRRNIISARQHQQVLRAERIRLQMARGLIRLNSGEQLQGVIMIRKGSHLEVQTKYGFLKLNLDEIEYLKAETDDGTAKLAGNELRAVRELPFEMDEVYLAGMGSVKVKSVGAIGESVLLTTLLGKIKVPRNNVEANASLLPPMEKNAISLRVGEEGRFILKGDEMVMGRLLDRNSFGFLIKTRYGLLHIAEKQLLDARKLQ